MDRDRGLVILFAIAVTFVAILVLLAIIFYKETILGLLVLFVVQPECCFLLLCPLAVVSIIIGVISTRILEISISSIKRYAEANGHKFHQDYSYEDEFSAKARRVLSGTPLWVGLNHFAKCGFEMPLGKNKAAFCLWRYDIKTGKDSSKTYYFTVVYTHLDFKTDAILLLRREDISDKIGAKFGKGDLNFEDKEFSDRFFVRASPQNFAYQFFHPRMMEAFIANPDFDLCIRNDNIILYKPFNPTIFEKLRALWNRDVLVLNWFVKSRTTLEKMLKLVPKYMIGSYEVEPIKEEDVPGQAEPQAQKSSKGITVACPSCGEMFKIPIGETKITCPHCGTVGEL